MFKFLLLALLPTVLLAQPGGNLNHAIDLLFNAIDQNDDRRIVNIEHEGYFLAFDVNTDGELNRNEFFRALDHASIFFRNHETQVFTLYNQDGAGNVTTADIDGSFKKADANSDNHLTSQELHAFINGVTVPVGK